jgi:hypothetical protein
MNNQAPCGNNNKRQYEGNEKKDKKMNMEERKEKK